MLRALVQVLNGYALNFARRHGLTLDNKKFDVTITLTTTDDKGNPVTVTNHIFRNHGEVLHSETLHIGPHAKSYMQGRTKLNEAAIEERLSDDEAIEEDMDELVKAATPEPVVVEEPAEPAASKKPRK